ncbi:DUF3226 domain-containing protein [Selenomonas sp. FOBRC9]|uniref:DUF3226 domain-containing protein n=1 Tax=Selenomonas sp. FOBRC9 TaxID=936573 RepID=UPI000567F919|nr:DUF3226 domain-containing protein [Selenomonas sp. FOBRC9]
MGQECKPYETEKILKEKLILAEGADGMRFCIAALAAYGIDDVQVFDFGGNEDLIRYLRTLPPRDGFDRVNAILIVRDAEDDAEAAQRSIRTALINAGFPQCHERAYEYEEHDDLRIGTAIFPNSRAASGALEDLCLAMIPPEQHCKMGLVDSFVEQADQRERLTRRHKTRLHAYLSIQNDFVGLKIGEVARAGAWDWDSQAANDFREMLVNL